MKKFFLILSILFVFNSCSLDDEPKSEYVLLPVESVEMPATGFNINEVNYIKVRYRRPTTCHLYDDFYIEKDGYTRTVAIRAIKLNENNCEDATEEGPYEVELAFKPTEVETYTFKFWTGTNGQGVDEYITEDVVIN
ncbi:hypothetical protein [Flavobacterium lacisediminis]|uniref:DUF4625 domain-containing protein n=1 Tax=Flavobacterium lacisediminis TaxID=2989705 RepID=A0ABT3EE73_9FLAO|nr:hypothetical protein [Flavobacterium lacisediminis]MCW1146873.1 hypothetical protein [Flavobacterium lacisediminis]